MNSARPAYEDRGNNCFRFHAVLSDFFIFYTEIAPGFLAISKSLTGEVVMSK